MELSKLEEKKNKNHEFSGTIKIINNPINEEKNISNIQISSVNKIDIIPNKEKSKDFL